MWDDLRVRSPAKELQIRCRKASIRDADIRAALRVAVEAVHRGEPDTAIIDELGIRQGQVRVDLAVVNGTMHGFEIKSLADTLRRLPVQADLYSQVLDYVTIVLAERHRDDALSLIPEWWGVIVAKRSEDTIELSHYRSARKNPQVNKRALAELLWHDEALGILQAKGADRGLRGKPRALAWDRLCDVCSLDEISDEVRRRIKDRPS